MSNERDELAALLKAERWKFARLDPKDVYSGGMFEQTNEEVADAILAAGYVKAEPAWAETLINDGTYEYTVSSDCDGSNVNHWRRIPGLTYEGQASPWTVYTPEETK